MNKDLAWRIALRQVYAGLYAAADSRLNYAYITKVPKTKGHNLKNSGKLRAQDSSEAIHNQRVDNLATDAHLLNIKIPQNELDEIAINAQNCIATAKVWACQGYLHRVKEIIDMEMLEQHQSLGRLKVGAGRGGTLSETRG